MMDSFLPGIIPVLFGIRYSWATALFYLPSLFYNVLFISYLHHALRNSDLSDNKKDFIKVLTYNAICLTSSLKNRPHSKTSFGSQII